MVYLIAQNWAINNTADNELLNNFAASISIELASRAQIITLLATGIYLANTVPAMLLGTLAGVWADRWPKRQVMVSSNALRAILLLLTPICIIPGPIFLGISWGYWALIIMTFLESILTQFFAPAEQATIPLLVPKKQLLAANSIYQATSMGATIIGFALGEPILRLLNKLFNLIEIDWGEFTLLPLCYGLAAIFIASIHIDEEPHVTVQQTIWNEVLEGVQVLKDKKKVRHAMIHLVFLYSLLAALYVLAISLASFIPILGPTKFGLLLSISGIGITVGSLLVAQIGHTINRQRLSGIGLGAITCCLVLLGEAKGYLIPTLCLCSFLGIAAALVAIPAQTTLQEDTPANKRGKVFGLQNNLINIALSLPLVLAGTMVSNYGVIPVLWFLAALALLAAIYERPWQRC